MKILHISYEFGDSSAVFRLAKNQCREGHAVYIYCKRGLFCLSRLRFVNINRFRLFWYLVLNRLDSWLGRALTEDISVFCSPSLTPSGLPSYVTRRSWDIVHIHWIASNFCSPMSALRIRAKAFLHLHDLWLLNGLVPHSSDSVHLSKIGRALQRFSRNRFETIIKKFDPILLAPSSWSMDQAQAQTGRSVSIRIWPGTVPGMFRPGPSDALHHWPRGRLRLLQVMSGQYPVSKGVDVIIKSLIAIPVEVAQSISLTIVGSDTEAMMCVNRVQVRFLRTATEGEMVSLYRAANFTLIWSKAETFSQSAVESLSCGTPIITHSGLPCSNFCRVSEGSVVAQSGTVDSCENALLHAIRMASERSAQRSLYHPEVVTASSTSLYLANCPAQ